MTTDTPDFFAAVPRIRLRDPLAAFLGAAAGGALEYGYADAAARVDRVPASPELGPLLQRCLAGIADASEQREFGRLWQDRVRRLLLEHGEDRAVFVVRESR